MSWFKKISQNSYRSDSDDMFSQSGEYFSIGHGDFNEEQGKALDYIVWVWLGGKIQASKRHKVKTETTSEGDPLWQSVGGAETHGDLWGHAQCDNSYKGRYEPQTGRLSVVKPCWNEHRPVPNTVMSALRSKFRNIKEILEF